MVTLTYQGYFKLPSLKGINWTQYTFNYTQMPIAYRSKTNTLILRGHASYNDFAEITIPTTLDGTATAAVVGDWFDPTSGNLATLTTYLKNTYGGAASNGVFHRGCFIDDNDIMRGTVNLYYNVSNLNFATYYTYDLTSKVSTDFVQFTVANAIKTSGYICELSSDLSSYYSRDMAFGETIPQGLNLTNAGPACYLANYDASGEEAEITWTLASPYLYGTSKLIWDGASRIDGMVDFPNAMAWIGRTPTADALVWYDYNYTYVSDGVVIKDGVTYTDPCSRYKGYHASNYRGAMFYIEHADLKSGNINIQELDLSWTLTACKQLTSAIDRTNGKLFVMEKSADGYQPVVHVLTFNPTETTSSSTTTVPTLTCDEQLALLNDQIIALSNQLSSAGQQSIDSQQSAAANSQQVLDLNNQISSLQNTVDTYKSYVTRQLTKAKVNSNGGYANNILKLIFNGVSYDNIADNSSSPLEYLYVSLHTDAPGVDGNQTTYETSYEGYSRVAVARTVSGWTVAGNSVYLASSIIFPSATSGSDLITYFGIGTSQTGTGQLLYFGPLFPDIQITEGASPQLTTDTVITEN